MYFHAVISTLSEFLSQRQGKELKKQGMLSPITQQFFLGRSQPDAGYCGNAPETQERWNLIWVALLNQGRDEDQKLDESAQWLWVTSSWYQGSATNAVVMHTEMTFRRNHQAAGIKTCSWQVCRSVPSKDTRVDYTTNGHLLQLSEHNWEELAARAEQVMRDNMVRAAARALFQILPPVG